MNATDIQGMVREPTTIIGLGLIAVAVEEFSHGFTPVSCIKFISGVGGVLLREGRAASSAPVNGTQSTSIAASVELKKEVSNNGNA